MKPLAIMTVYNRLQETKRCLESFEASLDALEMVIVDNGSDKETNEFLNAYAAEHPQVTVLFMGKNVGCPRALNEALLNFRQPAQPVIKIDNDVVLLRDNTQWVSDLLEIEERTKRRGYKLAPIAMIGAYYEPFDDRRVTGVQGDFLRVFPVIGHCVYHTGGFMNTVGFFDVLAHNHLYGFEDLLMSRKAAVLGYYTLAWPGWRIENIQRHSAIGSREELNAHVEEMRPLYNERLMQISPSRCFTNAKGELER